MIVYIDIFILENTILNFIILISTAIIGKNKINIIRFICSSLILSIYTFIEYYISNILIIIIFKLCFSYILIKYCFKKTKVGAKRLWLIFIMVSFLYGGISFFIKQYIKEEFVYKYIFEKYKIGIFKSNNLLESFSIGFIIIIMISKCFNNLLDKENMICDIEVYIGEKVLKVKALIDSGNMLKDPISKFDVIVVEASVIKEIIEKEYLELLECISRGKYIGSNDEKENEIDKYKSEYKYNIKIIPFSSLGNSNGILCGIKPDKVKIYYEEEVVLKNIVIGIYFDRLDYSGNYSSIIGTNCLKEELI